MTGLSGWRTQGLIWLVGAVLLVAGWSAAAAVPRGWRLDVGEHRAAAFLRGFRAVERSADGRFSYQWSLAESQIVLPRVLIGEVRLLTLRVIQRVEAPPRATVLSAGALTVQLPDLPASSRVYRLLVHDADALTLRSDLRGIADAELAQIGVMVDWLATTPLRQGWWPTPLSWAAAIGLALAAWLSCALLGLRPSDQRWIAGGLVLFNLSLALNWLPELVRGMACLPWLVPACSAAALALRRLTRPWLGAATDAVAGSVLLWLIFAGIGISYPGFVPTDVPFHLNRLWLALGGNFYMTAEGQGQTYPYPAGVYLLLAPLSALTGGTRIGLQWLGLAAGVLHVIVLSAYLVRQGFSVGVVRLNALLCAVLPAGFLLNAQAPLAQNIGGLLSTTFLLTVVECLVRAEQQQVPISGRKWLALVGLGFATAVGHFGVLLNTVLMSVLMVIIAPRALWAQRRIVASWLAALGLAGLLVYSVYLPLMIEQLGYLTDAAAPPSRWFLLTRFILDIALFGHYRIIFVVLAVAGWLWLYRRRAAVGAAEHWLLRWSGAMVLTSLLLMAAEVAIFFNATRYAIFMWPAISVLSAIWLQQVDRPGWRRLAIKLLLAGTLGSTLLQWFSVFALQSRNGFLS